ncbi:MAG: hypothetical protein J6T80_02045 [Paludibacteraceae bacterium]|nr:hypothetical protein [Paludibacteraceae bacterium]
MKRLFYIWMMVMVAGRLAAQLPHSYYCDFEDAAENEKWNLNTPIESGYSWPNYWYIGGATASLGQKSMYISSDGGATATYANKASRVVIAWRELQLEEGRYDLAFDWICGGDSARAAMLVAWIPESDYAKMECLLNNNYNAAKWISENLLRFDNYPLLTGSSVWAHTVDTIYSDGTPHRLVYIFVTSSTAQLVQPGPCVDNIQLCRNNCGEPTNMGVDMMSQIATLSWTSSGESFNIRMHRMGENKATIWNGINLQTFSASLQEGVYDIQIQVVCEGDTSVWYNFPTAFIHDSRCFDYLDLTNDRCYYSETTAANYRDNETLLQPGKIDYGFLSMWSRHTIHYNPDEYDTRTNNSVDSDGNPVPPLKTVPEGALASVRIGSWEEWAHVARVEYDFVVDAKEASVLMLQYALVLQSSGHSEEQRPRLTIDIIDVQTGLPLSNCTTVDLAAQTTGEGWYRVPMNPLQETDQDVCWRDWTTLGLNLAEFDGKHVKAKITVYGCTAEIHYGYAYFTLTCSTGKLQGIQCGWTPTNEFIAPEGFNYRWYRLDMPSETLSHDRIYKVDYRDTRDYAVDITYKSNPNCGFTLTANAIPRFPIPEATYKLEQRDCGNWITFTNKSHIRTRNWTTGEQIETPFPPEYLLWDFDGLIPEGLDTPEKRWAPSFRLPDNEADYHFQLHAGVGLCDSVQHIYIHVPAVGPDTVEETIQKCEGDLFSHNGKYYQSDAVIVDKDFNRAGCDSTHIIYLRYVDAIRDTIEATIPEGETYMLGTQRLTQSGVYTETFASQSGCDSIVLLRLTVVQPLVIEIVSIENPCPEDASFVIETHARKGTPNYYTLRFDEAGFAVGFVPQSDSLRGGADNTIEVMMPAGVKPGYYAFAITFGSESNGTADVEGELMVYYPASLIQQRWDDVLGILNSEYNSGYDFREFQWYRNNVAIEGATEPYLYEPDKLKPGDEYSVELKQPDEERSLRTCAYIVPAPASMTPQTIRQKMLRDGRLVIIVGDAIYNAQGQIINHQ